MSKRKPKALPLDSPHWKPLADVHRLFTERLGSPHLAAQDMTQALANGLLRSIARQVTPPSRRLLPQEFWSTYLITSWRDGLHVDRLLPHGRSRIYVPFRAHMFIWESDVINFFGKVTSATAQIERQLKTPTKSGTRRGQRGHDWAKIDVVIKRKYDVNGGWPRHGERGIFAEDVRDAVLRKLKKAPDVKYILARIPRASK